MPAHRPGLPRPGSCAVPRLSPALALVAAVLGAGCSQAGLYGEAPGPWPVAGTELVLQDDARGRAVPLQVRYPVGPGPWPVVIYSHGARCAPQNYRGITDHWASHGYVVLLPDHLDSLNNPPPTPEQFGSLVPERLADVALILDRLADLPAPVRADPEAVAVAGHSFGAAIAMVKVGLPLKGEAGPVSYRDPRISAAVIMSGVGPMEELMPPDAFDGLTGPLIATGGTLDLGDTGGPVVRPWEWRLSPYTLAPAGDKYSVVLEDGDHYLGGLICRDDRGGAPDPEGLRLDATLTLAFLDAYVRDDPKARRFLATADVGRITGGRVRYARK